MLLNFLFLLAASAAFGHNIPQQGTVISSDTQMKEKPLGDPLTCFLCMDVMGQLKTVLKDEKLQENLELAIENGLCPLLPSGVGVKCQDQVKMYGPMVFALISSRLDPRSFCEDVTLCSESVPSTKHSTASLLQDAASLLLRGKLLPEKESPVSCEKCLVLTNKTMKILSSNVSEETLAMLFEAACIVLPNELQGMCRVFVED